MTNVTNQRCQSVSFLHKLASPASSYVPNRACIAHSNHTLLEAPLDHNMYMYGCCCAYWMTENFKMQRSG